jgi:hypothetical protein
MPSPPFDDKLAALLSMKRALLGSVAPSLRAVTVDIDFEDEIYGSYFYYDGPIDDELFELVNCAETEASDCWYSDSHILQLDYPKQIPIKGSLAYLRKEPNMIIPQVELLPRSEKCLAESYLCYTLQQGLLGRVIPSLRFILIDASDQEKYLKFFLYYDEKITEEIKTLTSEAISIAKKGFSKDFQSTEVIQYLPYPEPAPDVGQSYVYRRYEK